MTSRQAAQLAIKRLRSSYGTLIFLTCKGEKVHESEAKQILRDLHSEGPSLMTVLKNSKGTTYIAWGIHAQVHMEAVCKVMKELQDDTNIVAGKLFPLVIKKYDAVVKEMSRLPTIKRDAQEEEQECHELYYSFLQVVKFATNKNYLKEGEFEKTAKTLGW